MITEKTIQQHIETIMEFAAKHNIEYTLEGECGFGRECVGFLKNGRYIDYNPFNAMTCEPLAELYNDTLQAIVPMDAYHKADCLAVLGRGHDAVEQLSDWATKLTKLGAQIVEYKTGATGLQALISGATAYAVKI